MPAEPTYWFPAKRYGWGWGWPSTWQGRAVLACFFALVAAGFFFFPPRAHAVGFALYLVLVVALLIAICWIKGEPPRSRSSE